MNRRRRLADVFLAPGELAVRADSVHVRTILGSCVAVCLHDRKVAVGGVNHFLLPSPREADVADTRFGDVATETLIEQMLSAGASQARLLASVIGGGRPISNLTVGAVGDDNTAIAMKVLRRHGIRVIRQDTGGDHGRKLLFHTGTGELVVHRVRGWRATPVTGAAT